MDTNRSKLDPEKSENGIWIFIDDETEVLVARWGNPKMRKALQHLQKEQKRFMKGAKSDDKKLESQMLDILSEHILLNWRGMKTNGKECKYSVTKARELLADPNLIDFRDIVFEISQESERFHQEEINDSEENIKKLSTG